MYSPRTSRLMDFICCRKRGEKEKKIYRCPISTLAANQPDEITRRKENTITDHVVRTNVQYVDALFLRIKKNRKREDSYE